MDRFAKYSILPRLISQPSVTTISISIFRAYEIDYRCAAASTLTSNTRIHCMRLRPKTQFFNPVPTPTCNVRRAAYVRIDEHMYSFRMSIKSLSKQNFYWRCVNSATLKEIAKQWTGEGSAEDRRK